MYILTVILLSLGAASSIQLGFLKGQRYTYNYQSEVIHSMPRSSAKTLGLRINSQVHADFFKKTGMQITLKNITFHQVTGNGQDTEQQEETVIDEKILKALQLPLRVIFKDGRITEMGADEHDHEWSLNIKRGLANLFQIAPEVQQREENVKQVLTQRESTVIGICPVSYVINPDNNQPDKKDRGVKISKLINYDQCTKRPELSHNIFYSQRCDGCQQSNGQAPYLSTVGRIDHTLISSNTSGSVIDGTEAYEEHVFTPFSRFGEEVKASVRQVLQFKKIDAVGQASNARTKKVSLAFTADDPDKSARDDIQLQPLIAHQTERLIEEMRRAAKEPASQQAAQKYIALIQQLRKSDVHTLEGQANGMLRTRDATERKYFLDVLSSVGTPEAFQVLKRKIQENRIYKKEELHRVFTALAFVPSPTADHIKTLWELCQQQLGDVSTRRQCLLSFGALVHKTNERARLQQDTETVTATRKYVQEIQNYLANPLTTQQDRLTAIKVLGNAGSPLAQGQLLEIIKDQSVPLDLRVNSVWSLRRIIPQAKDKISRSLIITFSNTTERAELRMAAFQLIHNSEPSFATLQLLANSVRREITNPDPGPRSNQVASFVISQLSAISSNDHPVLKKRAMRARKALRLLPRKSFGLSYSKALRLAYYSEKFQFGTEFEVNKMNVPESSVPRNMNARLKFNLLGYNIDAIELGTRVENMDNMILEQLTPNAVQRLQKRSLLGSALSFFTGGSPARKAKQGRIATYVRVFGDEVKFTEITQPQLEQLADGVTDLFTGRKDRLEFNDQGIVISKDKVTIQQTLEKAILLTDARRMLPTLAGIPLDIQLTSSAVLKLNGAANMNIGSSLWGLLPDFSKITGNVKIKPSVHAHADVSVGIHTPYLRMGLQLSESASANPIHRVNFDNNAGKSRLSYDIPQERRDIVHVKATTKGFVERLNPVNYERDIQWISMDLKTPHLKQLQRIFTCQDMFGVHLCVEGQVPNIASLRLQQIPVLPAVGQTEVRVSMRTSTDQPTIINWTNSVNKNNETVVEVNGQISSSSNTVQGRIPYKVTYRKSEGPQLTIEVKVVDVPGYENCAMNFTANSDGLKAVFGKGEVRYQVTASGQIQGQGKNMRLQTQWTELPEQWKKLFYNWQPQIWNALQQFAWIRRTEQKTKQVAFELNLTSPLTANLVVKTPDAEAEGTDLSLPVRIERLPQSRQEIFNNLYAQCEVTNQFITTFDGLQYEHNIASKCPIILVQEYREDTQSKRIELSVQIDEKEQSWTVKSSIYLQSNETVKVQPDLKILIDGSEKECNQTACQTKHNGTTVRKVQSKDGTTQIQLSTNLGLYVTIESQRIQVFASPFLRSLVRGLCGDADGEQWNEYRDAQTDQVYTTLQEFTQSWQQTC